MPLASEGFKLGNRELRRIVRAELSRDLVVVGDQVLGKLNVFDGGALLQFAGLGHQVLQEIFGFSRQNFCFDLRAHLFTSATAVLVFTYVIVGLYLDPLAILIDFDTCPDNVLLLLCFWQVVVTVVRE